MEDRSIPEKFFKMAGERPGRTLFKNKEGGEWRDVAWSEVADAVKDIGNGFLSLGLQAGERVAILAENRLDWIYADLGLLAAGAVVVTIYPSNLPHEVEYIVSHSGSRFIVISGQGQYQKLADRKETMPALTKIISLDALDDPAPDVISLSKLRELGREVKAGKPNALKERTAALKPDDLCTMVYTSGTTGPPKGAMITHGNILAVHEAIDKILKLDQDSDMTLSILPYAHVYERIGGIFNAIFASITIAIGEGLDKIAANVAEIRPTLILGAPRLYEKMYAGIQKNIAASSPTKQKIFAWAMGVGKEVGPYKLASKPLPLGLKLKYALADKLVFSTIKQKFGGRIRFFVSAAAPISKDIIEFFHALDILIIEGWGMTETSAPSTINRPDCVRFGSVGQVLPGTEVKIAADGEVMVRGPNVFMGYYSKDGPIRDEFADDGWFHTGDIGRIDDDGFLYITDRKKDIIITAGGKNISPQNIENILKTDLYISEALVFGDRMKFLSAIITLDEEAAIAWAQKEGIAFKDFAELSQKPETKKMIETRISVLNRNLPKHETIKKIQILDRQFQQDLGEITPTMKLKRKVLNQKFGKVFEQMYAGLEDGDF
ncbi:MAG TPA: long-chain fatty acid--CoA ligase [bacterium]|nr:long-chain fatty acid--CoA ligase [bacterium]